MDAYEWFISTFMLMSILLTPYAPAETLNVAAPTETATRVSHSSYSKL